MDEHHERIKRAWTANRSWVVQFTGAPHQTYLSGAPSAGLAEAIGRLSQDVERLRALPVWRVMERNAAVTLSPSDLVARLESGEAVSLSVNYVFHLGVSPLDVHLVVELSHPGRVDITAVWWADQAFPEDEDMQRRFAGLMEHFLWLADVFETSGLYLGPETEARPGEPGSLWVEV